MCAVVAVGHQRFFGNHRHHSDMFGVGEGADVAGERGGRRVGDHAWTSTLQERVIPTESDSEILDSVRVDEVVDGAVGVQQKSNGSTAIIIKNNSNK